MPDFPSDGFFEDPCIQTEAPPNASPEDATEVEVGPFAEGEGVALEIIGTESKAVVKQDKREREKDRDAAHLDLLREREDLILQKAAGTVEASLDWAEVAEMKEEPPEWIAQYGPKEARKRFITAQAALNKRSEAPVGLDIAQKTMMGIIKARATERNNDRPLNLQVIQIGTLTQGEMPQFPTVIQTEGEEQ